MATLIATETSQVQRPTPAVGALRVYWGNIRNGEQRIDYYAVDDIDDAIGIIDDRTSQDLADSVVGMNWCGLEEYETDGWFEFYNNDGDNIDTIMEARDSS